MQSLSDTTDRAHVSVKTCLSCQATWTDFVPYRQNNLRNVQKYLVGPRKKIRSSYIETSYSEKLLIKCRFVEVVFTELLTKGIVG